ncbi:MAG: hypothetical protein A3D67_01855 [Candidatus Lloydbacteria bacterium RIFCSPHIGHO2_02_FULL_51_22]|uniref:Aspartyl/glutamyl-tRNA(Asn/Gln) amidotransferase subunit C n=2 Tax=Candidatus Lloydiibacteriota TaxID=1817910 RepID=A0A1G2DCB7_9BACT|nr:MAG: hypothetical protein A3D67_01855 [Candidatus Lloydbacteria bacterium RIFCSPHIGHO2_02_FULL_51_22]OGZ15560.1 MAG: hypothetical protein A3J08_01205 [Candidatus Lloydbacteria bacterium RIFCSPLOWO2_02_FULL_51_11]
MDKKEIARLASLARIKITDEEIPRIAENLARVVEYVSEIQRADIVESVALTPTAGTLHNVMREDTSPHETGLYTEAILENAPVREGDYIKVKKIL